MTRKMEPRELSGVERSALNAMLSVEFEGVEELREQARHVRAWSSCECGCGTIGLDVDRSTTARSPVMSRVFPVDGQFDTPEATSGLIPFTRNGWLTALEVWSVGDPAAIPDVAVVRVGPNRPPDPLR